MTAHPKHHRLPLWRRFFKTIGPGFITGAADDDPSGIGTYVQTGSIFGFSQLWVAPFTSPFMVAVQEMCGRIGLVKGRGLAFVIREKFGRKVAVFAATILLIANATNIGADLGAMASTMQLLLNLPFVIWLLLLTAFILALEIFVSYKVYAGWLKWFGLSLLAYVAVAFTVHMDWSKALTSTFWPHISFGSDYFFNLTALFGTIISPYLFFWQTSEEVEEEVEEGKIPNMDEGTPHITSRDISKMRKDTVMGMVFSNVMTWFIIASAAATLGAAGLTNIGTASEAAEALRPLAGNFTYLLFTLGIIGTGMLAVPVLAGSASYAIAETIGWRTGLYRKLKDAHGFYGIITVATLLGLIVNFVGIPPFKVLYYTAVLNGVLAPPLLILIILIANDKKVMGRHKNGWYSNIFGWGITAVMLACAVGLAVQTIF